MAALIEANHITASNDKLVKQNAILPILLSSFPLLASLHLFVSDPLLLDHSPKIGEGDALSEELDAVQVLFAFELVPNYSLLHLYYSKQ